MTDELLTVEEVTERLKLGRTKIYELMDAGELPSITFGAPAAFPRQRLLH